MFVVLQYQRPDSGFDDIVDNIGGFIELFEGSKTFKQLEVFDVSDLFASGKYFVDFDDDCFFRYQLNHSYNLLLIFD